jgi:hypothetical protein
MATKFDQLTAEMQADFIAFARTNGRCWKQTLRDDWFSSNPQVCGALRQYRNQFGPRELTSLKVPA